MRWGWGRSGTGRVRPGDRGRRGFTLIELLVVIGVIAVLIAITLPALAGARRASQRVACLANLKGIGTGVQVYLNEQGPSPLLPYCLPLDDSSVYGPLDTSPEEVNPDGVLATFGPMLDSSEVLICPSDDQIPMSLQEAGGPIGRHSSYEYWAGALMLVREVFRDDPMPQRAVTKFYDNNQNYPVFSDSADRHPGGPVYDQNAVYFGDWHADWLELDPTGSVSGGGE